MPRRNVCWGADRYKTRAAFTGIIRSLPPVMIDLRKPGSLLQNVAISQRNDPNCIEWLLSIFVSF
jgi:hypothetical protein